MLQYIVLDTSSGSATNTSNDFIWIYSQIDVTIKDASGNTLAITQAPCWLPPGCTVVASATHLMGLQGQLQDFSGFLSRPLLKPPMAPVPGGIGFTVGFKTKSAPNIESDGFELAVGGDVHTGSDIEQNLYQLTL